MTATYFHTPEGPNEGYEQEKPQPVNAPSRRENAALTVYRVRQSSTHPERSVRKAWYGRTWQAEWEPCPWCPRAYTERGVRRKAARWQRRGLEWHLRYARQMHRVRAHVSARRDPFYAELRKAGKL